MLGAEHAEILEGPGELVGRCWLGASENAAAASAPVSVRLLGMFTHGEGLGAARHACLRCTDERLSYSALDCYGARLFGCAVSIARTASKKL